MTTATYLLEANKIHVGTIYNILVMVDIFLMDKFWNMSKEICVGPSGRTILTLKCMA